MKQQTIICPCDNCEGGNEFTVLRTALPAKHGYSGIYVCQCTVCGHEQRITGKSKKSYTGKLTRGTRGTEIDE